MLAAQVKMCNHSHVQYPVAMNPMYWKLIVLQSINGVKKLLIIMLRQ